MAKDWIRNIEIEAAITSGKPRNDVAKMYGISPGRASEIASHVRRQRVIDKECASESLGLSVRARNAVFSIAGGSTKAPRELAETILNMTVRDFVSFRGVGARTAFEILRWVAAFK